MPPANTELVGRMLTIELFFLLSADLEHIGTKTTPKVPHQKMIESWGMCISVIIELDVKGIAIVQIAIVLQAIISISLFRPCNLMATVLATDVANCMNTASNCPYTMQEELSDHIDSMMVYRLFGSG